MRKATKIELAEADRRALIAIVTDRNSPQKHVWRAQIVLLTANGCGTMELTRDGNLDGRSARMDRRSDPQSSRQARARHCWNEPWLESGDAVDRP